MTLLGKAVIARVAHPQSESFLLKCEIPFEGEVETVEAEVLAFLCKLNTRS
jgi:hypothetical protein